MRPLIRKLNLRKDQAVVLEFQHETYQRNFPGFQVDKAFLQDYARQLRAATNSRAERLWVLEVDGQVCGFVWGALITSMVDSLIGYIKNIHVLPRLRGRGYAKQLIETAEAWFRSEGAPKSVLDASVVNEEALGLYQAMGYQVSRLRMEKLLE